MAMLSYGGVVFDLLLVENWARRLVLDPSESDYLHTKHALDVIVTAGGTANDRRHWPAEVLLGAGGKEPLVGDLGGVFPNDIRRFARTNLASPNTDLANTTAAKPPPEVEVVVKAIKPKPLPGKPKPKPIQVQITEPAGVPDDERLIDPHRADYPTSLPWTDQDIRQRLRIPRQQLLVWVYSRENNPAGEAEFLLVCPLTGVEADARNGPFCTILDLPHVHGNAQSLVYRLRFECSEAPLDPFYTNTTELDTKRPVSLEQAKDPKWAKQILAKLSPIVSHRWSMRQVPDPETHLSTFETEGVCILRRDALLVQQLSPDLLRAKLMHPVPLGYRRLPPVVEQNEAGDAIRYFIQDKEVLTHNLANRYGAIQLDVQQGFQVHFPADLVA